MSIYYSKFPKNELVSHLEKMGVKFGADLNAYTSCDETVYFLPIPADDMSKVKTGLDILEDWAFNMTMDGEEIFFIHGLKVVRYPDRSVRVFSDENEITNVYLLSKLLEDISNMEDCDITIIPKSYWVKKHTIY